MSQSKLLHHVRVVTENSLLLQTLYSLPWLLIGVLYVLLEYPESFWTSFSWSTPTALVAAFLSARLSGMSWNRLIDAAIDAKNQRTQNRLIPTGKAKSVEVAIHAVLFLLLFFIATTYLPKSCQLTALPVGLLLIIYSFTKRFTSLCHMTLGAIYFMVPISAALAFGEGLSLPLLSISLAAGLVVTGCDVLYSCQDANFDKRLKLRSIPADHGIDFAVRYAASCHGVAAMLLCSVLYEMHMYSISWAFFFLGCIPLTLRWKAIFAPKKQLGDQVALHFPYLVQLYSICALIPFVIEVLWRVLW